MEQPASPYQARTGDASQRFGTCPTAEAETPSEALFVCGDEACGRRVVVGKSRPHLVVIDRGDFSVRHAGSLGGVTVEVAVS